MDVLQGPKYAAVYCQTVKFSRLTASKYWIRNQSYKLFTNMRYRVSSRAVLGPYQTSAIEPFVKTVDSYQPFTIFAKSLIIDV